MTVATFDDNGPHEGISPGGAVATLNRPGLLAAVLVAVTVAAGAGTYAVLTGLTPIEPRTGTILGILILDLSLLLTLAAVMAWWVVRLWTVKRIGARGARLHTRFVALFSAISVVPAILVALFGAFSLNLGIESWFSERVKTALDSTVGIADAYLGEHKETIRGDVLNMAYDLNSGILILEIDRTKLEENLNFQVVNRGLSAAAVFNRRGDVIASEPKSYLLDINPPSTDDFNRARAGELVFLTDPDKSQVKALVALQGIEARFLLVSRYVDATILAQLTRTTDAVNAYRRLEENRTAIQLTFGLVYAAVALVILLTAILIAVSVASRLVTPIGRLIGAAERVSAGDLDAQVDVARTDDELAALGRVFNRMTSQLSSQRKDLIDANRKLDDRRRFTEAVLSGVSAGVIGLDGQGHVTIINRSALNLLGLPQDRVVGRVLTDAVPELAQLVDAALAKLSGRVQGQLDLNRDGKVRHLNVRVTDETAGGDSRGYVVTFDDITELVSAQRTSAWADVARRIAHEIKNPLTPIQLSAERIRRKYGKEITSDPEVFEQCTQTIIRQVGDIGRMVDEFSSFARMPAPVMKEENLTDIVRQVVFLQRVGNPNITYALSLPEKAVFAACDGRLVSQALLNVLKNAAEAVNARYGGAAGEGTQGVGRIEVELLPQGDEVAVIVTDNGIGLPNEDRSRLTEPYVTTRAKGTGLGLAIVKKIMEDHGGTLLLEDAPQRDQEGKERGTGARVCLVLKGLRSDGEMRAEDDEQERASQGA